MDLVKIREVAEQYKALHEKMNELGMINAGGNRILLNHVIEGMKSKYGPVESACKGQDKIIFAEVEIEGLVFEACVYDTDPEYAGIVAEWESRHVHP